MAKTAFLAVGLVGMAAFGLLGFSSPLAAYVAAIGLTLGFLLRKQIPLGVEMYPLVVQVGLVTYGVTLVAGRYVGLDRNVELSIITGTTVVLFNLQFWGSSDPRVYKG